MNKVCKSKFLKFLFLLFLSFEFAFSLNLNKNANTNELNAVVSDIILQCEISQKDKSKCETESFIKSNLRKKGIKFDNKTLKNAINLALNSNKFENLNEPLFANEIISNSQSKKETNKKSLSLNKNSANPNKKEKIEIFFSDENENSAKDGDIDLNTNENKNLNISNSLITLDFNTIQEISVRSAFSSKASANRKKSSNGKGSCTSCHDDSMDNNENEFDEIVVTAKADNDTSWRDNIIYILNMISTNKIIKNANIFKKYAIKNKPKAIILQEVNKAQIIDLFENDAKQIYIGKNKYVVKEVKTGPKGAKIFEGVSNSEVFKFFMETAGVERMPKLEKVYENGVFKGNRYTVKTPNGNYNLRDYSTSSFPNGTKPKWTFDVPIGMKKNGKPDYRELKFE